ncbi:YEATS domain-containing protein 4 [Platysternon megacephalum]|uniref:YEATS domain-containing protein 4 n=1 Tax=Platysternon megacephalum TaxID=55544 RepID=A0A4D9ENB7_9SAUR|nr:YEATS domain-containing protein 4 [Platysternon megacephalum]
MDERVGSVSEQPPGAEERAGLPPAQAHEPHAAAWTPERLPAPRKVPAGPEAAGEPATGGAREFSSEPKSPAGPPAAGGGPRARGGDGKGELPAPPLPSPLAPSWEQPANKDPSVGFVRDTARNAALRVSAACRLSGKSRAWCLRGGKLRSALAEVAECTSGQAGRGVQWLQERKLVGEDGATGQTSSVLSPHF